MVSGTSLAGGGALLNSRMLLGGGAQPPFSFITRVAPHCVNTLRILHAAHEDCTLVDRDEAIRLTSDTIKIDRDMGFFGARVF